MRYPTSRKRADLLRRDLIEPDATDTEVNEIYADLYGNGQNEASDTAERNGETFGDFLDTMSYGS